MNELIKKELKKKTSSVDKGKVSNMRLILQEITKNIDGLDGVDDEDHDACSKALANSVKKSTVIKVKKNVKIFLCLIYLLFVFVMQAPVEKRKRTNISQ